MTKPTTGEQQSTDQANETMTLSEAVRTVRKAIAAEEDRLKELANDDEADPVLLTGETTAGYIVHVKVDHPEKVVQIMLDYQHPLHMVLEEDSPQEMWDELARMAGLDTVFSADI